MNDVRQRLARLIVSAIRSKKPPEEIQGTDLIAELGISSIDALEILINVEIEFGIQVKDEDLTKDLVSSLDNLERYVTKRPLTDAD